jgi:hypothetical protein
MEGLPNTVYVEMRKYLVLRRPLVIYFLIYEVNLILFFISVAQYWIDKCYK